MLLAACTPVQHHSVFFVGNKGISPTVPSETGPSLDAVGCRSGRACHSHRLASRVSGDSQRRSACCRALLSLPQTTPRLRESRPGSPFSQRFKKARTARLFWKGNRRGSLPSSFAVLICLVHQPRLAVASRGLACPASCGAGTAPRRSRAWTVVSEIGSPSVEPGSLGVCLSHPVFPCTTVN